MIKAVKKLPFLVNLLIVLGLTFLIIFVTLKMLGRLTKHGEYMVVPDVMKKDTKEAIKFLEGKGFDVEISDSTYTDTAKNGIVLKQIPDPNSTVKVNRTVFLVVNRYVPPMVDMPKLEGLSIGFAIDQLERNHLKLQDTLFKPSFEQGSIIEQQLNGQKIQAGAKVQWGSKITLIVGGGLGGRQFMAPDLIGLSFSNASRRLDSMGILAIPVPDFTIKDSMYDEALVWKQNPKRFDELGNPSYVQAGMVMDLFITKDVNKRDTIGTYIPGLSEDDLEKRTIIEPAKDKDDKTKPRAKPKPKPKPKPTTPTSN